MESGGRPEATHLQRTRVALGLERGLAEGCDERRKDRGSIDGAAPWATANGLRDVFVGGPKKAETVTTWQRAERQGYAVIRPAA